MGILMMENLDVNLEFNSNLEYIFGINILYLVSNMYSSRIFVA